MQPENDVEESFHACSACPDPEDVPVVILSRWRLADRIARPYGMEACLIVDQDENPDYGKYMVLIRSECGTWSMPWVISDPMRFHNGLVAVHTLLEQVSGLGKSLGELLEIEFDIDKAGWLDANFTDDDGG